MNPIEEVLRKWNNQQPWDDKASDIMYEILEDIHIALKNCSILEWHPGNERPNDSKYYLCEVEPVNRPHTGLDDLGYLILFFGITAKWHTDHKVIRWTELPERSAK